MGRYERRFKIGLPVMSSDYLRDFKLELTLHDGKEIIGALGMLRLKITQSQPEWSTYGLKCIESIIETLQTAKLKGVSSELISDNCC